MIYIVLVLVGAITGIFSGLLGVGGGLIIVPSLMIILDHYQIVAGGQLMHVCIGTSLACGIPNLLNASFQHNKRKMVRWSVFYASLPGVLLGAFILGPVLVLYLNDNYLKILFGLFCLFISLYLLLFKKLQGEEKLPGKIALSLYGFFVAAVSTLLGIAGGAIIGALFSIWKMGPREVVGTISAIGLPITIAGTIGIILISHDQAGLPALSTGYVYWPAFFGIALPGLITVSLGAHLSHKLPVALLKKIFACLVLIIGLKMLL